MGAKRRVEIFSAGCPQCRESIERIRALSCPSCEIVVHDMHGDEGAARAKRLGVSTVPAVTIDGRLATCCTGSRPDEAVLRASGLGQPP